MQEPKFVPENPVKAEVELPRRARALDPTKHDAVLQARVAERLRTETAHAGDVSVVVKNRSATLFGTVESEQQRALIQDLALQISGLLEVNNRIKLIPTTH